MASMTSTCPKVCQEVHNEILETSLSMKPLNKQLFLFFFIPSYDLMHKGCLKRTLRVTSQKLLNKTLLEDINSKTIIYISRIFNSSRNVKGNLLSCTLKVKSPFTTSLRSRLVAKKGLRRMIEPYYCPPCQE